MTPHATKDAVLGALRDAGDAGVSGESLARSLGVSRAAVAKHVAALRGDGYRIEATPGLGYVLAEAPDRLVPAEVRARLTTGLWDRIEGGGETGSTNDDCKRLARAGVPEGAVCIADSQTAGRGRLGREWSSPAGGAYMSVLLRPVMPLADVPPLALVTGLAVARTVERLGVSRAGVKWPNDVLLDVGAQGGPGKLAGILLETSAEGDVAEWVVIGIGMNVRRPSDPVPGAAYLSDADASIGLADAAAAVLEELAASYQLFQHERFRAFAEEYEARLVLIGREVTVRDVEGVRRASGTVTGVDEFGRLLLDVRGTQIVVAAGDVTLRDS